MKRLVFLALVLNSACIDRSLDVIDPTSGGPTDFSTSVTIADLATTTSTVGISCNGDTCNNSESCCPFGSGTAWSCAQNNQCAGGVGYRCDGPEDCTMGRICIGDNQPDPGFAPLRTRCRNTSMGQPESPDSVVVCHTAADCKPGSTCVAALTATDAPSIRICN